MLKSQIMIKNTDSTTSNAVTDLILLNNDRYEGYQKTSQQAEDEDLKDLFSALSHQSKEFSAALKIFVEEENKPTVKGTTTNSGKLHQVWMDVKNALSGKNRKSVLTSCLFGEEVLKEAYETTLAERDKLDKDAVRLIQKQYDQLLEEYNRIRTLRESLV